MTSMERNPISGRWPSPGSDATLEIDLSAITANWRALDALGPAVTGAAVKADGYGLGAAEVARALHQEGCRRFFVATLSEAAALDAALAAREAVIHVLNGFAPADAPQHVPPGRLVPVLSTFEAAQLWSRSAPSAPVALQLETGMNRLGIDPGDWQALAALSTRLSVDLLMSHLACSDEPEHLLNLRQKERFDAALEMLRPAFPDARASLAATGGALLGPDFAYDLVRPGIGLYGGLPFANARAAVELSAPLIRVWSVREGEASGYGATWTARRDSVLATIPLGYADGIPRVLSGVGMAHVNGDPAPFAGRVSMDLIVLDVTECGIVATGDRAWLLDDTLTVDRMADAASTIGYEILTKLGYRAERRYKT